MAADDEVLGRGVSFPLSVDTQGRIAIAGGPEKVRQSVLLILGTEPGDRLMRSDFGCHVRNLVFEPNSVSIARRAEFQVREALLRWEPRIDVESVSVDNRVDGQYGPILAIQVMYRVKASGFRDRVNFELPVG